jgi:ribosomal protein S18 acetylase RimI-like enzyme
MPPYRTRPAREEDSAFLFACYKQAMRDYVEQAWGWDEAFQRASFAEHLPWRRFEMIVVDGAPVGGLCVREAADEIELEMFILAPRVQRMGIGSDVLIGLMRRAREEKRRLSLSVLKVNPARALYERLGFRMVGEHAETVEMEMSTQS